MYFAFTISESMMYVAFPCGAPLAHGYSYRIERALALQNEGEISRNLIGNLHNMCATLITAIKTEKPKISVSIKSRKGYVLRCLRFEGSRDRSSVLEHCRSFAYSCALVL